MRTSLQSSQRSKHNAMGIAPVLAAGRCRRHGHPVHHVHARRRRLVQGDDHGSASLNISSRCYYSFRISAGSVLRSRRLAGKEGLVTRHVAVVIHQTPSTLGSAALVSSPSHWQSLGRQGFEGRQALSEGRCSVAETLGIRMYGVRDSQCQITVVSYAPSPYAPSECKKRSSQRYQVLVLGEGGNTKKEKGKRNQDANVIWHPPSPRILRFWGTGQGEYATTSPMASHTGPAWPATVTADVGRISGRFPPVAAGRLLLSAHTAAISRPTFLQPRAALKCYVSCSRGSADRGRCGRCRPCPAAAACASARRGARAHACFAPRGGGHAPSTWHGYA